VTTVKDGSAARPLLLDAAQLRGELAVHPTCPVCGQTQCECPPGAQEVVREMMEDAMTKDECSGALRKAEERMRHDYPILQQFHSKHALGALAAPSCLCCGHQTHPITRPIAVQHMELPAIVVCKQCKDAAGVGVPHSTEGRSE
jgi:hypothetical protein